MPRTDLPWISFAETMSFALDCQQVVALRLARIAQGGPTAQREVTRMITEKATAVAEAHFAAFLGLARGGPVEAVADAASVYQRAVNANGRRLRAE